MEVSTRSGAAFVEIDEPDDPAFVLALTHGAGGGVASPDLLAARAAGLGLNAVVARVTQPYRASGARAPGSARRQDAAWLDIIAAVRECFPGLALVQGGRSNGARLACRTARAARAIGVVALAFPLHPPGKADQPERSRAGELRAAIVPVLAVNGARDPFGVPVAADVDRLVVLPGEVHSLSRDPAAIEAAVAGWLRALPSLGARPMVRPSAERE